MENYTTRELTEALRALRASVIKCEKLMQKFKEDSWQHRWALMQHDAFTVSVKIIEGGEFVCPRWQLFVAKETLNVLKVKCNISIAKSKDSKEIALEKRRHKIFSLAFDLVKKVDEENP